MATVHRISSEDVPPYGARNGADAHPRTRTPHERLGDHLAAARAIVDLAAAAADQQENDGEPQLNVATMRRALREALRHLEQAELIAMDLPEAAS